MGVSQTEVWDTFITLNYYLWEQGMISKENIYEYLAEKNIDKVDNLLVQLKEYDEELLVLVRLVEIYKAEAIDGMETNVFEYSTDIDVLYRWFIETKLYIRRLDFDINSKYEKQFYIYCKENKISVHMLACIIVHNVFDKEKVIKKLIRMYMDDKGEKSKEVQYMAVLLGRIMKSNWNRGQ